MSWDDDKFSLPNRPGLVAPEYRYRMRRLTDDEMNMLVRLARDGRKGPGRAMEALWDLILREAEGISYAEAKDTGLVFAVQNCAIPSDQSQALYAAFVKGRRLARREVAGIGMLWLNLSPADYDAEPPAS